METKRIKYYGKWFTIPAWAEYITTDVGMQPNKNSHEPCVFVWLNKPVFMGQEGYWLSTGRLACIQVGKFHRSINYKKSLRLCI